MRIRSLPLKILKTLIKKIILAILAILIIATPLLYLIILNSKSASAAWYSDSWQFRKKLTIDRTKVSGGANLSNFPVLVSLTDLDLGTRAQSSGNDILFTSSDGTTKLNHDIESFNATTGVLIAWVNVTTVYASSDTVIYLYYGNATAPSQQNATGVWDSNYKGVWHLKEDPTGASPQMQDSTTNVRHGTANNMEAADQTSGKIGGALDFGGTDERVSLPNTVNVSGSSTYTIEAWFKTPTTPTNEVVIYAEGNTTAAAPLLLFKTNNGDVAGDFRGVQRGDTSTSSGVTYAGSYNDNNWHHAAWVRSAANSFELFTDGVSRGTSATDPGTTTTTTANIGVTERSTFSNWLVGLADELRVSSTNRPSGWIITSYNNQNSPSTFFKTVGAEEKNRDPVLYLSFDDGQGTTAQDSSPTNNNGALSGTTTPTWQQEGLCVSGKCLYFDGATSYVGVGSTTPNVQSVGFWVKPKTNGESTADLDGGTHTITASSGTISANGFTSPTIYVNGVVSSTLTANTWQYVEVTTATSFSSASMRVGTNGTTYLNGFIDEFKVYDYRRSAAQVKADYNARGSPGGGGAVLGVKAQEYLSKGLIGYWKMDESSGNASDSSGNGITLTNNGITTFVGGKFGNGSEHVPASSQHFSTATTINGIKSVSFWVNPDATTNYYVGLTSGAYIISSSGTISATGFTNPTIYVNGQISSTIAANAWQLVTVTSDTAINADTFYVGRQGSNYFDGTMDEVRLYNRALSPREISDLYSFAPGPVGYWNFEEKSGSSASDLSGLANTGTITNAVWSAGRYGTGLKFDGAGDYVSRADDADFDFAAADNFTVEAWVKHNGAIATNPDYIITKGDTTNGGYQLYMDSSGNFCFGVDDDGNPWDPDDSACSSGTNYSNDGKWHHLAGVKTATTKIELFIDGVSAGSDATIAATGTLANTGALYIGIDTDGSSNSWDGWIDEPKIYNYARTQKQIVEDMNAGHPAVGTPVASAIAHWEFDEGYSTTANDSTPNANNLTLSSASWTNSGKFGKAWNGTGALWLSRADDSDFDVAAADDYAVSLWFKSDSASNPAAIEYLFNKESATTAGYAVYVNTSGQICFGIDDDTTWDPDVSSCTSDDIYDNSWHHLVGVRDTVADKTLIYIDGVLKGSNTDTTTATLANSLSLYVGDRDGTDNGDEFNGDLDEIKVYRYALTADEVKTEYNRGSSLLLGALGNLSTLSNQAAGQEYCVPGDTSCASPVGEWKFEEKTGTSANDTSGNNLTGTLTGASGANNTPQWKTGKIGAGLDFDGTDDHVALGNVLQFTSSFSVSAWINPRVLTLTDQPPIIVKTGSPGARDWALMIETDGTAMVRISDNGTNVIARNSSTTISTNTWTYISGVYNASTQTLDIYVNGRLDNGTLSGTVPSSINATNNNVRIGSRESNDKYWNGKIDQVRVFNYARSAAQIAWDYNRGKPVARWEFDECQGTTLYDSSANSYNGSWNGSGAGSQTSAGNCNSSGATAWYNGRTGKFNSSLNFDGTDDYVSVTDTANLRFDASTADFSLFAWVKRTTTGIEYILSKEDLDNDGYRLLFTSSNAVQCSEDATDVTSTSTITDTNWHLVGCTIDRDGNGQVYIDGKADGSAVSMGTDAMATTSNITIATRSYTSTSYFNGQIDDVRIYNYALTSTQVKNIYNNGAIFFGPSTGSP